MPRLLVHRGESLYREVELTGATVQLGRGPDNNLVLEDAGKSVSRNHAEIRFENGQYVLVDRGSQNGIWVSGSRRPSVVLEHGVVASLGPYRLTIDPAGQGEATEYLQPTTATQSTPTQSPISSATVPELRQLSRRTPVPSAVRQPLLLWAGVAAGVVVALGFGIWLLVRGGDAPPPESATNPLDSLSARITNGDCGGALNDLQAFLANHPTDTRALELKSRAENCPAPPAAPPTPPTEVAPAPIDVAGRLETASMMLGQGDCQVALEQHINPVLEIDPTNLAAAELKKKAENCVTRPLTPPPTAIETTQLSPEQGWLPRIPGENQKNYQARVAAMKDRYAEAERAISAGDYPTAVTLLDAIIRDTSPKYLNASDLLTDARTKESAQRSVKEGRDFENKGDLERALEAYRRARQLDSGLNVDPDIKRVTGMRIEKARQVCEEANARYSYGRNAEALQLYQEAVKLLPADDPCVVTAKERFSVLKR